MLNVTVSINPEFKCLTLKVQGGDPTEALLLQVMGHLCNPPPLVQTPTVCSEWKKQWDFSWGHWNTRKEKKEILLAENVSILKSEFQRDGFIFAIVIFCLYLGGDTLDTDGEPEVDMSIFYPCECKIHHIIKCWSKSLMNQLKNIN